MIIHIIREARRRSYKRLSLETEYCTLCSCAPRLPARRLHPVRSVQWVQGYDLHSVFHARAL